MNIIYFTTALDTDDFEEYRKIWAFPINASKQIFHNKLIRSLSLSHHVDVISLRPFSKDGCMVKSLDKSERVTSRIHWHYLGIKGGKFNRVRLAWWQTSSILRKIKKDSIIITDTINPTVFTLATYASKRKRIPLIGVVTDSPSNIDGTKRSYTLLLLKLAKHLDGTISLTPTLNDLYNDENKPNIIIEGLCEDRLPKPIENRYGKYFFYSGSLSEKYGIYSLIEAFNELNQPDYKLLICGHHEGKVFLEMIRRKKNIKYLGILPNKECIQLEQNAFANINPRPFNEDLDRFSVPSKLLEYFNSGRPTISTKTSRLFKVFQEDAIWIKSGTSEEIKDAMLTLINLQDEERNYLGEKAKNEIQKYYSLSNINKKLDEFLQAFFQKN